MIVITGAAGFIGSVLVWYLNKLGYYDLVLVDEFSQEAKNKNLENKIFNIKINRNIFFDWAKENHKFIEIIIHLGARTDTTEQNYFLLEELNLSYSKKIWNICVEYGIPLIYASSAATYGAGEFGFDDDEQLIFKLKPLNKYALTKNEFDKWAVSNQNKPYFWVGLKFFNVFGPNEYHKKRMASVLFHSYNQIINKGCVYLFKSYDPKYPHGEQKRDFIYVKDVCKVIYFFMLNRKKSGIYNVGTGQATSFNKIINYLFEALNKEANIEYIDMPEDIKDNYQYFTQANINKLINAGFNEEFYNIKEAVFDYVINYLKDGKYL